LSDLAGKTLLCFGHARMDDARVPGG
jgi:hypothetical protein